MAREKSPSDELLVRKFRMLPVFTIIYMIRIRIFGPREFIQNEFLDEQCVNLICGESGGFRRGKHSAALFHNLNQDVRMAVHGDDFVCLLDDDGLKHTGRTVF